MYALAAAAEVTVLWRLSAQPSDGLGVSLPGPSANLLHVVSNAVLAVLLVRSLATAGSWPGVRTRTGAVVLASVLVWGVIDETHQFWIPGRTCSVFDLFADVLGGLFVLVWPGEHPGRPRTLRPALIVLGAGVGAAVYGWLDRPFPDRVLEQFLERFSG